MVGMHRIDNDNAVGALDLGQRIEESGPDLKGRDILRQPLPLEGADDMHAHTLVAEKKIAYA
jgi:hypothetical protein